MKRVGYLYEKICSVDNLILAAIKASRGKSKQRGVIEYNQNVEVNIEKLHLDLKSMNFVTSQYSVFKVHEPKERLIFRLPFYPDRIVHHAIINIIGPILTSSFISSTYSCIKGRGIHKALNDVRIALRDEEGTRYCMKLDIKKFFPNVDHNVLKELLKRKFKDEKLLSLLDSIIDSSGGLPIGNFLSTYFGNFYLTYFDHWIKEKKGIKHYARYCDDMIILHSNKEFLHDLRREIAEYLKINLRLELKYNYQIFLVASRGIDFVGYKCYHTHSLLRKNIKKNFIKMIQSNRNEKSINSYNGWIKHCNGKNLLNTHLNEKNCNI